MEKDTENKIIEMVENMSVLELNSLVKAIETKFGVSAAVSMTAASSAEATKVVEPTEVSLILKSAGANKIAVIKEVRTITGLGLMEAKNLTDKPGSLLKDKLPREEAEKLAASLKAVGAEVEIK